MKNKNQFIEGGWSFKRCGNQVEEVLGVMALTYTSGHRKGQLAEAGDTLTSLSGGSYVLSGASAPHKPSSTGRVYVEEEAGGMSREFFPSVFNLAWKRLNKKKAQGVLV